MVAVQIRPPTSRPMGWMGFRGFVPSRGGRGSVSKPAALGALLAVVLAAGGTVATVAAAPPAAPPAMACAPATGKGSLTAEQRQNAATIVAVGKAMGASEHDQVIALATAMQESTLHNHTGGDRDSAGLFQQRPSQGWGSYAQVTDPTYSARTFYSRLAALKGRARMPVTVAAQTVQRSAYPNAYAKHEPVARALVAGTACRKT